MQFIVFQYIVSHWNSFLSDGRKAFTSFLKSEYSQENIEFWEACEDFKQTSVDEMNVNARKIFERYVEANSPSEVRALLDWNISIPLSHLKCTHKSPLLFFRWIWIRPRENSLERIWKGVTHPVLRRLRVKSSPSWKRTRTGASWNPNCSWNCLNHRWTTNPVV